MNFIFKLFSGGTAIVSAETKENALKRMETIFGVGQFELKA